MPMLLEIKKKNRLFRRLLSLGYADISIPVSVHKMIKANNETD
jgi:hypothetical protein